MRVGVLHRPAGERAGGLGGAVLAGLGSVSTAWVVVMDGDLQHPPELAARLATIGEDRAVDLVVASRNIGAGDSAGLSGRVRHTVSGSATLLGRVLFPRRLGRCTDPLSGFFALRRSAVDLTTLRPDGFKILVEILVRNPWLRLAEVPVRLGQRHAGESKASVGVGLRFGRRLAQLRLGLLIGRLAGSFAADPRGWLTRVIGFGAVGLTGLVVNTVVLWLLHHEALQLPYLLAAALATQVSTAWLFVLTDGIVFRNRRSGTRRGRALRFFAVNNTAMLLRLPVLAALVEWAGTNVLVANALTLVLLFLARFLTVDLAIYGRTEGPTCPRVTDPIRGVVDSVGTGRPVRDCPLRSYLPYRYSIPDVATIGSQIELPELAYFRAQWLGNDTEIQLRVGLTGERRPHRRAQVTQLSGPPSVRYQEHLGRLGANFAVQFGDPMEIVVSPRLARSPHVVYTNVLEALLRFVAVSKGVMLLHSACVEIDGRGVLISARTDTGKTGTVLRLVREYGARFLSDDMTVLHPDGRVGCFPKPLTISRHTLALVHAPELTAREWRWLDLQSRIHSREGRQFALLLSRLNLPIMAVNALAQRVVPPPKYPVDQLQPCSVARRSQVTDLFLIERGEFGAGELGTAEVMAALLANTEDAYQFPPFRQLAPSIVIGQDDHAELRRREQQILASAISGIPARWVGTPDFSWAPEIARQLAVESGGATVPVLPPPAVVRPPTPTRDELPSVSAAGSS